MDVKKQVNLDSFTAALQRIKHKLFFDHLKPRTTSRTLTSIPSSATVPSNTCSYPWDDGPTPHQALLVSISTATCIPPYLCTVPYP
jgi:hypothetical protein